MDEMAEAAAELADRERSERDYDEELYWAMSEEERDYDEELLYRTSEMIAERMEDA